MLRASRIKSISYVKANAARIIRELSEVGEPLIITQKGEAKAVIRDFVSYEREQETLALLKILALADRNIEEGKTVPLAEAMRRVPARLKQARARNQTRQRTR